ncbi:MAG: DNA-3-methyladenine glycosylase I [Cytophagales bacterium]
MKKRCAWADTKHPIYVAYHDHEWGVPVHEDQQHFEMLSLEGAQAGLSWLTILRKRAGYRKVFAGFEVVKVAAFTPEQVAQLCGCSDIVRNRLKIASVVNNARCFLDVQQAFGSFDNYLWGFVEQKPILNGWQTEAEVPASTSLSEKISKDLKKRGFRFVGPTIIYAYMQAIGMVNDHVTTCFRSPHAP